MHQNRIILIEGKQTDHPSFFFSLKKKGYNVEITKNGPAALDKMKEAPTMVVLIDAASLRISGNRVANRIKKKYPEVPVIIIIDDSFDNSKKLHNADLVMTLPFTINKLLNRIALYIPSEEESLKKAGKITLDLARNFVYVDNRSKILTPRLALLLSLMMDHPGEMIERKELFCRVWETEYMEDMRSLDVHMRWLRKAIEKDPAKPKFIITVRGKGYKLNPDG